MAPKNKDDISIYLGLTCIPGREKYFSDCIKSLINQKKTAKKIFISYCENYVRFKDQHFDEKLIDEFKNEPVVEFIKLQEDKGPATKFLAPWPRIKELEKNNLENCHLIVCDDDRNYCDFFVEHFTNLISQDDDVVYTGYIDILNKEKGFNLIFGADGYNIKCSHYEQIIDWTNESLNTLPEGKESWHHDDFVVSSFLHLNKFKIKNTMKRMFSNKPFVDDVSLTKRLKTVHDDRGSRRNSKCWAVYNKILFNLQNKKVDYKRFIIPSFQEEYLKIRESKEQK